MRIIVGLLIVALSTITASIGGYGMSHAQDVWSFFGCFAILDLGLGCSLAVGVAMD